MMVGNFFLILITGIEINWKTLNKSIKLKKMFLCRPHIFLSDSSGYIYKVTTGSETLSFAETNSRVSGEVLDVQQHLNNVYVLTTKAFVLLSLRTLKQLKVKFLKGFLSSNSDRQGKDHI